MTKVDETPRHSAMIGNVDVRQIADCTCLRLRRAARAATRLYDAHLEAAGVTIGQFGVLAWLYGAGVFHPAISIKELSSLAGMDPTTLNRTLKPLEQDGLVASSADPADRRTRLVALTPKGVERLAAATKHWEAAQRQLRDTVGLDTVMPLDGLLDVTEQRIRA